MRGTGRVLLLIGMVCAAGACGGDAPADPGPGLADAATAAGVPDARASGGSIDGRMPTPTPDAGVPAIDAGVPAADAGAPPALQRVLAAGSGPDDPASVGLYDADATSMLSFTPFAGPTGGVYVALGTGPDATTALVVGAGKDHAPLIRTYDACGTMTSEFLAYLPAFTGGVRVAMCDLDGDGQQEIVTAPGPGMAPLVRAYREGLMVKNFFAFDPATKLGAYVACGDVDGDGKDDIIVGQDAGGLPEVRVFASSSGMMIADYLAYYSDYTGGVRVAAGDFDGDGKAEVVTAPGDGHTPLIEIIRPDHSLLFSFYAFSPLSDAGAYVATAQAAGGHGLEIIAGSGAGEAGEVRVFSKQAVKVGDFMVGNPKQTGGVPVAAGTSSIQCLGRK